MSKRRVAYPERPSGPPKTSASKPPPGPSAYPTRERVVIRQEIAAALRIMADYLDGPVISTPAVLRCVAYELENRRDR